MGEQAAERAKKVVLRGLDHRVVYGFDRVEDAMAFRHFIAERWPERLDETPVSAATSKASLSPYVLT